MEARARLLEKPLGKIRTFEVWIGNSTVTVLLPAKVSHQEIEAACARAQGQLLESLGTGWIEFWEETPGCGPVHLGERPKAKRGKKRAPRLMLGYGGHEPSVSLEVVEPRDETIWETIRLPKKAKKCVGGSCPIPRRKKR